MIDRENLLRRPGVLVLGLTSFAFGALGVLQQDFLAYWQPAPENLPFRQALALCSAAILMTCGAGLLLARTERVSAAALSVIYLIFAAMWLPRVFGYPHMIGAWLGCFEQAALSLGAASIFAQRGGESFLRAPWPRLTAAVYALFSLIFGLSHWLALQATISMVPAWAPGDPALWGIGTGVVHVGVAIALLTNWRAVLATRIAALMYASFAVLVWGPASVERAVDWLQWSGVVFSLALAGAVLALGDWLKGAARPRV